MKISFYVTLIFIFFSTVMVAQQNLVPNPSFEDTIVCPTGYDQMYNAFEWTSYRNTPDYINSCNNSPVGIPQNVFGYQYPASGNAYANLFTYFTQSLNLRECIGAELLSPLVIGVKYFASFKVSRAVSSLSSINIASNKIGIKFSSTAFSYSNPILIDNHCQIWTDSIITDTLSWIIINGSFIADSAYQYISIGNFFTDSMTSIHKFDTSSTVADYFIDDIYVGEDSLENKIDKISNNGVFIYPNPIINKLIIISERSGDASIYNLLGHKLVECKINSIQSNIIDLDILLSGIYILNINLSYGSSTIKKIIKL